MTTIAEVAEALACEGALSPEMVGAFLFIEPAGKTAWAVKLLTGTGRAILFATCPSQLFATGVAQGLAALSETTVEVRVPASIPKGAS